MNAFNPNFYESNLKYTRTDAEKRLNELGHEGYWFTGQSYANGASFYFINERGEKLRVSDHNLTGRRAFEVKQISITEVRSVKMTRKNKSKLDMNKLEAMIKKVEASKA